MVFIRFQTALVLVSLACLSACEGGKETGKGKGKPAGSFPDFHYRTADTSGPAPTTPAKLPVDIYLDATLSRKRV